MYLLALAEQGMDISGLVVGSSKPKLPNHLISQRGFALADGVISVYDDLRVVMLVDQSAKQWFTNEIASFSSRCETVLVDTWPPLAEMWVARVTQKAAACGSNPIHRPGEIVPSRPAGASGRGYADFALSTRNFQISSTTFGRKLRRLAGRHAAVPRLLRRGCKNDLPDPANLPPS